MKIKGKLKLITNEKSGTTTSGTTWRNLTMVIDTGATYNAEIALTVGNKVYDQIKSTPVGTELEAEFNLKSREYQGKWYTDVEAWKITNLGGGTSDVPF